MGDVRGVPAASRARERAALAFGRDTARTGQGSLFTIAGAAGVGKTWLCETAVEDARHEGFSVGWGTYSPNVERSSLLPWSDALGHVGGPATTVLLDAGGEASTDSERLRSGAAVVDELARATADTPGLVVIDDAQNAGEPGVQLATFLARHVRTLHLVILVAYRPEPSDDERDRGSADELSRIGTQLVLHGLDRREVTSLLADTGIESVSDADIELIMKVTRGRPADVRRAALAPSGPVRSLVDGQLATLPTDARHVAARAAVLDEAPRIPDIAALGDVPVESALRAISELEERGLAYRTTPERAAFAHDEVRTALAETLPPTESLDVHARAVDVLEHGTMTQADLLARRADHAIAASSRSTDDARRAVTILSEAAEALAADHAHARAAELFASARDLHERSGFGSPPAALQVAHATSVLRSGRLAMARELFDHAATAAELEHDRISLAAAAAGYGGIWLSEMRSPLDQSRVLGLQRRSLAGLPDGEHVLRCRLEARLAAEEAYAAARPELMATTVEAARALDDPAVLAEVLSLYHHTLLGPEHAGARQAVARELLSAATSASDALMSLMGLCWLTVDLFLDGEDHAQRALGALRERVEAFDCPSIGYIVNVMRTMLVVRSGQLDLGEQRAADAFELGIEVGDADALAYYGAQIMIVRWIQGRSAEALDMAVDTNASPTITLNNHAFTAAVAALAADCGDLDRARVALTRLRTLGLDTIPSSSAWMSTLFCAAEAAHLLDDKDAAREIGALLAPFADLPVIASLGVICLGSSRRPLGLIALTLGDADAAVELLKRAVVDDERLGNRPLATITTADLATALCARTGPGDREAAIEQLDRAIREAETMTLDPRVATWRGRRDELAEALRPASASPADEAVATIGRQGSSWILMFGQCEAVVPHLVGMTYLAYLLQHPGREIPAADLMTTDGSTGSPEPEQPVLDQQALAQYRQRVADLETEIAEAEEFADIERASRARIELDAIVDELGRTTNTFGRARSFSSTSERARTAVHKAIRRALDQIDAANSSLGTALRQSVRTGRNCCYEPGPGAPPRWVKRP